MILNVFLFAFSFVGSINGLKEIGIIENDKYPGRICFCTVLDNLHVVTSSRCFLRVRCGGPPSTPAIPSGISTKPPSGDWTNSSVGPTNSSGGQKNSKRAKDVIGDFRLRLFNIKGELDEPLKTTDVIVYPFCQPIHFNDTVDESLSTFDDISIVTLDQKLDFDDDVYLSKWPLVDNDLENMIEIFENSGKIGLVWKRENDKSYKAVAVRGHLIKKHVCFVVLGCLEEQPLWCYFLNSNYTFRCLYHSLEPVECLQNTSGAPVFVDGAIWGFTFGCFKSITIYVGIERSFRFIHEYLAYKRHIDEDTFPISTKYLLAGIGIVSLTVILCFLRLLKASVRRDYIEQQQYLEGIFSIDSHKPNKRQSFSLLRIKK